MLNRRDFLKLGGLGGAGLGLGLLLGESTKKPVTNLIPYLVPPEDVIPGVANWYASLCTQCHAGCGIIVRVMEGRAKKIEGNPQHPVNRGRLCVRGQAGLQVLYNPDRIKTPLRRQGRQGEGGFQEITWEEGLSLLTENLKTLAANQESDRLYLLTSPIRGHLRSLLERFMRIYGSPHYLQYDLFQHKNLLFANRVSMGMEALPYYDIANTKLLLSFGADFLDTWVSPVNHSLGYGHLRQGRPGSRGKVIQIEPRLSLTGANADEWIPVRPGTEGLLALGMAYAILEGGYYHGGDKREWQEMVDRYHPKDVAVWTEVDEKKIRRLAEEFASAQPALAIGGENISSYENGVSHLVAVNILNHLAGTIGKDGGPIPLNPPLIKGEISHNADSGKITDFTEDALRGDIKTLILYNTNPVFTTPKSLRMDEAFNKIPFIVSLSGFMDESTAMADLILPAHSFLEDWGDDFAEPGASTPVATVMQPVVSPLWNTKGIGDIFLSLAKGLGGSLLREMPWDDFGVFLKDSWRKIYEQERPGHIRFDDFWNQVLTQGGWWGAPAQPPRPPSASVSPRNLHGFLSTGPSRFDGSEKDYPFYLILYPHSGHLDGRGANLPWLQEMPDPMTSVVWGSWVEMNPQTAKEHGIREGDMVWVESPYGRVSLPVYLYPGIRPDTISIPIGQGHRSYGRYATGRGANPMDVLPFHADARTGAIGLNSTRVRIVKNGETGRLVKMEGSTQELGRNIVQTITPEDFNSLSPRRYD